MGPPPHTISIWHLTLPPILYLSPHSDCPQVHGCNKDLTGDKAYFRRHRICEKHLKSDQLLVDAIMKRFCQQVCVCGGGGRGQHGVAYCLWWCVVGGVGVEVNMVWPNGCGGVCVWGGGWPASWRAHMVVVWGGWEGGRIRRSRLVVVVCIDRMVGGTSMTWPGGGGVYMCVGGQ